MEIPMGNPHSPGQKSLSWEILLFLEGSLKMQGSGGYLPVLLLPHISQLERKSVQAELTMQLQRFDNRRFLQKYEPRLQDLFARWQH